MNLCRREFSFDSCVTGEKIFVRTVAPEESRPLRGIVQIAHGMAEHSLLYENFAQYLASNGFFVAANDHLGHGKSVSKGGAYGYFGKGGCQNMVDDMHRLFSFCHEKYQRLPYFLIGHSMGSFLARRYASQYGDGLSGLILLGTGCGPAKSVLKMQRMFAEAIVRRKGPLGHDPLFEKLSTGRFNHYFSPTRTPNDWLSRDEKEVDRYTEDPLCGFVLTVSGYRDILDLQAEINSEKWGKAVPDIPILFASGDQDPVGAFGKGVRRSADYLLWTGHTKVTVKLYHGARHVPLCETNRSEVYRDLLAFLTKITDSNKLPEAER